MIETLSFRTQARTVDHLGREQIADCPTAISELWKNAYDAYARNVSLHIFDDPEPVAAIFDDGHGMSFEEFEHRWLIVGTNSKFDKSVENEADRDGLPKRTKQGQKGIGRLSSANLGPLLLLVSKRKEHDFVAALIDWRVFENPYLVLSDIEVPVIRFKEPGQLFKFLPELFERLMDNIWGSPNDLKRTERLKLAWETYDRVSLEEAPESEKPSQLIANTIINAHFDEHQIEPWSVWSGESQHGTALLVSDINHDLRAQLGTVEPNSSIKSIREQFFATLSAFTDPFVDSTANEKNAFDPQFTYEVITWTNQVPNSIIEDEQDAINRSVTDEMEHVLSGNIDGDGVFHGHIKAFGEWRKLGTDYKIYPPKDFKVPKGPTTLIGPFSLHVATFELKRDNSTLSDADHSRFLGLAEQHSGFLVFRNGLRVLPYGRTDNDFFQIETRRSISAGREFWNARRMFGRVAISREINPNLKDKAGREGFIDNQSAKALRILVANILRRAAYEYFGQASELRKKILPDIQERNAKAKAEIERKNLSKKNALKFRSRLKVNLPKLIELTESTRNVISSFEITNQQDLENIQSLINDISNQLSDLRITGAPTKLGSSEDDYRAFRNSYSLVQDFVRELEERRAIAIEEINPDKPEDIAQKQLNSFAGRLQAKLRSWKKEIEAIQGAERERVKKLFEERTKVFHSLAMPLVEQVKMGKLELDSALEEMKKIQTVLDTENEDTFQSYLDTLEIMSENINIELIASQGTSENVALRDEINRLNEVAQLGVTVEIVGHELSSHERMVREGLRQVKSGRHEPGARLIEEGFEALSEQLGFLSPLKVSGNRIRRKISGEEIFGYLEQFFHSVLRSRRIKINASDDFQRLSLYEQPSRILPVFINLVNNSVYWLVNSHIEDPVIALSVINGKVVVSDNGPGIDQLDQESLFKIFFSRKSSRGRGIGLYLCRTNLMAGGHTIEYATERNSRYLSGANFVIDFKGASID
ncbi:ATP-binding protein [Pseudidiomarina gelatinasegens]|uniref:ATP-binding protein n=1 Tax=Pseudidiomarina gelatinasegens TaxID=2487740 RepID=UPI0030EE42D3|tara:strand:+ start:501 stop:3470 length:2970 start_codon:yes stop_codon:yes gene_type:complete